MIQSEASGACQVQEKWHQQRVFHFGLIALLGLLVYSNIFNAPFVLDDGLCISQNPVVQQFDLIFNSDNLNRYRISEGLRNSLVTRFVSYATFALNYKVHGFWLPGYHLFNLFLHVANACLIYLLVQSSWRGHAVGQSLNRTIRLGSLPALITALLFISHPVMTNAVTYTSQRFASLATFFYLLTLLCYRWSALATSVTRQRAYYATAVTTTIIAMYCKEISFTLPVMLALYDAFFLKGTLKSRLRRLAPFGLTMLLLPVTVIKLATISSVTREDAGMALELANLGQVSQIDYAITQLRVVVTYLRLMVWPAKLTIDYDYPLYTSLFDFQIMLSGLFILVVASGGGWLLIRARSLEEPWCHCARIAGFGIIWFFVTLSMESSFIPLDDLMFEYRLYLPSIGFFVAIVAGGYAAVSWLGRDRRYVGILFGSVTSLVLIVLSCASYSRNEVWRDPVTLWGDAAQKSPYKARAHIGLAGAYMDTGRYADAAAEIRLARSLPPPNWIGRFALASLCNSLGMIDEAIEELKSVIPVASDKPYLYAVLGQLYLNQGDTAEAIKAFETSYRLDPGYAEVEDMLRQLTAQSYSSGE